jgi:hypothetical protein
MRAWLLQQLWQLLLGVDEFGAGVEGRKSLGKLLVVSSSKGACLLKPPSPSKRLQHKHLTKQMGAATGLRGLMRGQVLVAQAVAAAAVAARRRQAQQPKPLL